MKKSPLALPVVLTVTAMAFAGCAKAPGSSTTSTTAPNAAGAASSDFKACMVSDEGGFDDKSFNQTSHKGLTDAKEKLSIQTGEVESTDAKDFEKNLQSMVDAKCNVIVTVGFMLGDATLAAAKANPNVKFAIVDNQYQEKDAAPDNLKPLIFNTAESSYLAGYAAAAMTKTGKVGTFGGLNIPTVTIFMDGFEQGVKAYNAAKGKSVQVLGWDATNPKGGTFVPEPNPFSNVAGGKQTAANLKSQGADIIFPVAGPAGEGALQVAQESGNQVSAIWVDTDGYVSASKYGKSIMTSVYKAMDVAVFNAIKDAKEGSFSAKPFVGTLKNDGTGISPWHDFDAQVPADLKSELEALKGDISSGKIKIESASQPK
ncbi:MAG: BMP family lipoprotein [Propionibacteriaceae bacterium]